MIGLMDLTSAERSTFRAIAEGWLVWCHSFPRQWGVLYGVVLPSRSGGFLWMTPGVAPNARQDLVPDRVPSADEVATIESLFAKGVVELPAERRFTNQVMPTREFVPLLRWLQGLD